MEMMYVFYVNRGVFYRLDLRFENESILSLKRIIEKTTEIPVKSQVILVSGGDEPSDNSLVRECHAGSDDNNPIYLFRKVESENLVQESTAESLRDVRPLLERVSSLMNLQPSYNTVQQRVRLSKDFNEHSKAQVSAIRRLVKEQHMMSQGWYVALANLDEKCERIRRRYGEFTDAWDRYMEDRDSFVNLVVNFEAHVDLLERIRLPDALVEACCAPQLMAESSVTASQVSLLQEMHQEKDRVRSISDPTGLSLLDWMSSFDKRGSLSQVLGKFRLTLERVNSEVAKKIALELPDALALANENAQEHRVVQGLEQRLTQMSHYQNKAEARTRNQYEMMTTLASNLERLERERDASVVGELCKQHKRVLSTMAENHKKQTEAVQFALNGKNDFMRNLHMRFAWLTRIEMMLIHQETYFTTIFKRLRDMRIYREILQQAKSAAPLYAQTLTEMVRRREFSQRYIQWTSGVVDHSLGVYQDEVARRKAAAQKLDKHFLLCLFRSLKHLPSKFATKPPTNADAALPDLTRDDLAELRARVPELSHLLTLESSSSEPLDAGKMPHESPQFCLGDRGFRDRPCLQAKVIQEEVCEPISGQEGLSEPMNVEEKSQPINEESLQPIINENLSQPISEEGLQPISDENVSQPISVPERTTGEGMMGISSTGSPFVEMRRPGGEEDEIFSSALLNLEDERSRRLEHTATQTEVRSDPLLQSALSRISDQEVPSLRRALAQVNQTVSEETALAREEAAEVRAALEKLSAAYVRQLSEATAKLEAEQKRERETITASLNEAYLRIESLSRELHAERQEKERLAAASSASSADAARRSEAELDLLQRKLLLEHEVALESERGRHASEMMTAQGELREAQRVAKWSEERVQSLDKERELLDRAARAEKKVYEAEILRLRNELDTLNAAGHHGRRTRRVSVSSECQQHILVECPRRSSEGSNNDLLMEDSDLDSGWVKKEKEDVIHEQDQERISQLEDLLAQRDNTIHDLRVSMDRLSQQVMRDRDHIRQLRGNDTSGRPLLSTSPQMLSRSPPVLEQPAPISSFLHLASSPSSSTPPVTSPPKSVMPTSSMTESAISSVSSGAAGGHSPSSPAPGGPGRDTDSPPIPAAMMTSASAITNARGIKLVLSLFRSGDRVLLLRNPSTCLWFMLSTDGWSYFVHKDCFTALELSNTKLYMFAEFKSKERCLTRRSNNRFSLPNGDYFFRIKARPLRSAPGQPAPGQIAIAAQLGSGDGAANRPLSGNEVSSLDP